MQIFGWVVHQNLFVVAFVIVVDINVVVVEVVVVVASVVVKTFGDVCTVIPDGEKCFYEKFKSFTNEIKHGVDDPLEFVRVVRCEVIQKLI